jgi:predicted GTPase
MPADLIAENERRFANEFSGALRDFSRLKLGLASVIRSIRQMAEEQKADNRLNDCRKLLSRVAEERFNVGVVGQFSRGKTSLMDAILREDRLPTSVLPLTSVITSVSYGDRERALIHWNSWSYTSEIPLEQIAHYVTQEGNRRGQKRVRYAEVQLPAEILRLGFYFVDTPGVGSAIAANTATTEALLPEADAVIFVTSFDSPLAEAELQFLRCVRRHVRKILVVVNKLDLISADQQQPVAKPSLAVARLLVEEQSRALDRLSEDMQAYSPKRDALRRELATELERKVHEIGLARLVGLRNVVVPWTID